jgi:demethylmenaquinone methyltransferase/2-methoxy-6-polyprenyl-1,4-benzoquinol methylase/phosphoethanolamine N-methyltransferase
MDQGWRYDGLVWWMDTFRVGGRIHRVRRMVLERTAIGSGDSLLDVGCGSGTLVLHAGRRVRPNGRAAGIDPTPGQISWARRKATWLRRAVDFQEGSIDLLPFPDESFDAVTSTLMLHHLSPEMRRAGLGEVARVLRPGGRLVVADFDPVPDQGAGHDPAGQLAGLLEVHGFAQLSTDRIAFPRPHRGWIGATIVAAGKR